MSEKISKKTRNKILERDHDHILEDITDKPTAYFKSGELLFNLYKIGYTTVEILHLLPVAQITIERRILEYLTKNNASDEDFEIFYNQSSLKYLDIFKQYVNSNLDDSELMKRENIDEKTFDKMGKVLFEIPFFKAKIEERKERISKRKDKTTEYDPNVRRVRLIRKVSSAIHIG